MVVLERLSTVRQWISSGYRTTIAILPNYELQRVKVKILVWPDVSCTAAVIIDATHRMLDQVHELCYAYCSVDRGHRHSTGVYEVAIWLSMRPPRVAPPTDPPRAPRHSSAPPTVLRPLVPEEAQPIAPSFAPRRAEDDSDPRRPCRFFKLEEMSDTSQEDEGLDDLLTPPNDSPYIDIMGTAPRSSGPLVIPIASGDVEMPGFVVDPHTGSDLIGDVCGLHVAPEIAADPDLHPVGAPVLETPTDLILQCESEFTKCIRLADLLAGQRRPFDTSMESIMNLYARLGGSPAAEAITALKTRVHEIFETVRFSEGDVVMISGMPPESHVNGVVGYILNFQNSPAGCWWYVKIISQTKPLAVQRHNLRSISPLEYGAQAVAHDANPLRFRTSLREASK